MIKQFAIFIAITLGLGSAVFFAHLTLIDANHIVLPLHVQYLYFGISAILIYTAVYFLSTTIPDNAGVGFLALIFMKLGIYILLFGKHILSDQSLSMASKGSILLPLMLFLIIEGVACAKVLNPQQSAKDKD